MRIKALKTFVSGQYGAERGASIEVPDKTGQMLIDAGIAEKKVVSVNKKNKDT